MTTIKNNRLTLENVGVTSLSDLPDDKLAQVAAKYQIGTTIVKTDKVETIQKGRTVIKSQKSHQPKNRQVLEDEIRSRLTVVIEIPIQLWSDEQKEYMATNQVLEIKEAQQEQAHKEKIGIRLVIPPFEAGSDIKGEAAMLFDVSDMVWRWINEQFNRYNIITPGKDGQRGQTSQKPRALICKVDSGSNKDDTEEAD